MLLAEMVRSHLKTICFCSVRKICELVLNYARHHLHASEGADAVRWLGAYRGGLTSADRRRIERHLYDGTLRGVTATSSLELGVDIADLDGAEPQIPPLPPPPIPTDLASAWQSRRLLMWPSRSISRCAGVVMLGFPGSIASLWQRAGRCGRSASSDALAIMIAYPSVIDQWAMRHPQKLLAMNVEASVVDTHNPIVLKQHLLCAAKEQPLTAEDERYFVGEDPSSATGDAATLYHQCIRELHAAGQLVALPPSSWRADVLIERPAERCNIRSIDPDRIEVIMQTWRSRTQPTMSEALASADGSCGGAAFRTDSTDTGQEPPPRHELHEEVIDEVERWRCWYELYEGAIYLNQGRKLQVVSWEVPNGIVRVRPTNVRYYTGCLDQVRVRVLQRNRACPLHLWRAGAGSDHHGGGGGGDDDSTRAGCSEGGVGGVGGDRSDGSHRHDPALATAVASAVGQVCVGRVHVTLTVSGFVKRWQKTGEIFEQVPLSMPPSSYSTRGCWLDLPRGCAAKLAQDGLTLDEGLHACAHAMLAMLPLHLTCEAADVGCECDALRKRALWPKRLLFFDRGEGGLGITDRAHRVMVPLLSGALDLMRQCPCTSGCYCCVHSSKCSEYNAGTDKRAAIALAELIIDASQTSPAKAAASAAATVAAGAAARMATEAAAAASPSHDRAEGGVDASTPQCEPCDDEQPSMLSASIRRLRNLAASAQASSTSRPSASASMPGARPGSVKR